MPEQGRTDPVAPVAARRSFASGSGNDNAGAIRDIASGSKNQQTTSIKGTFKAAAKSVTLGSNDAPQPVARKRRGGGEGRMLAMRARRQLYATKSATRGRYKRLAVRQFPPQDEFAIAAKILCSVVQGIVNNLSDLARRIEAIAYGKTPAGSFTLSLVNPWGSPDYSPDYEGIGAGGFAFEDSGPSIAAGSLDP